MPSLLDKRLIVVTGKGGTGKSTVAMALGMLAAGRGLRTIVAEVASQDRAARAFERDAPLFREQELAPGLWTISIAPERAMAEYLRVRAGAAGDLLASSRTFGLFAAATPGMRELLTIGKVWELAQLERRTRGAARYDLVILDAPATGHGVGIMRTPKTFADLSKVGPISQQGRAIHASLSDPDFTGVLAVARPEEMAVDEEGRTYRWSAWWPPLRRVCTGPLSDLEGVWAESGSRGYLVYVGWRGGTRRMVMERFQSPDSAVYYADEMAAVLGVPRLARGADWRLWPPDRLRAGPDAADARPLYRRRRRHRLIERPGTSERRRQTYLGD